MGAVPEPIMTRIPIVFGPASGHLLYVNILIQPWHVLVMAAASFLNREQEKVIACLRTESGVLREQARSRGGRLCFTDKQRVRLAAVVKEPNSIRRHLMIVNMPARPARHSRKAQ